MELSFVFLRETRQDSTSLAKKVLPGIFIGWVLYARRHLEDETLQARTSRSWNSKTRQKSVLGQVGRKSSGTPNIHLNSGTPCTR